METLSSQPSALDNNQAEIAFIFNSIAAEYDDIKDLWYSWLFSRLHLLIANCILQIRRHPGRRGLDVGCGTGFQTILLGLCGYDVVGVDIAQEIIDRARLKEPIRYLKDDLFCSPFAFAHQYSDEIRSVASVARGTGKVGCLSYQIASATRLPFEDEQFDVVNCCGSTLSLIQDYRLALKEIRRVLRPGGHLFLEVENKYNLDLLWPLIDICIGRKIGYHLSIRETLRNIASPINEHIRINFPFSAHSRELNMPLWLFSARKLISELQDLGLRLDITTGVHSVTNILPSVILDCPNPPPWLVSCFSLASSLETLFASAPIVRRLGCSLVLAAARI